MDARLLGRRVIGDGLGEEIERWFDEEWMAPTRGTPPLTEVPFTVRIAVGDPHARPASLAAPRTDEAAAGLGHRRGVDDFWVVDDTATGPGRVHGRLNGQGAALTLHGAPGGCARPLHAALVEAFTRSGLLRLHAAALQAGDRTLALLGPSGRGKSTTFVRGLAAGWCPVAEDGCWLEPRSGQLVAADHELRLLPEGLELLRRVRPAVAAGPGRGGKVAIPLDDLRGRIRSSVLTDLVLLERGPGSAPVWGVLSEAQAAMALYQSTGAPHTRSAGVVLARSVGHVARTMRALRLGLGALDHPLAPPPR